jgi:hypothetical protein
MNTIKIGGRTYQVEFDGDTANVQITEMLTHTRLRQIESVMRDLPAYVQFKHKTALTTAQLNRLWNTLTSLRLQNIPAAIYKSAVALARAQPFTCMSIEPFYTEIDRAIRQELNNPQLPLPLEPVAEAALPSPVAYAEAFYSDKEYSDAGSLNDLVDISQLALPLVVTE